MRSLITRLAILAMLVVAGTTYVLSATLSSDCINYAPGDIAVLTGAGFQAGELIDLSITIDDSVSGLHIADYDWTVEQADVDGGFVTTYTVPPEAADMTLTATAVGYASGLIATVSFVDAAAHNVRFATSGLPAGISVVVNWNGTNNGGNPTHGPTTFTSPGPSADNGVLAGTLFSFAFPMNFTIGASIYNLVSTSETSPFTTGASGGRTTVTAVYELSVPADTTPPTTTAILAGTAGNNGWYVSDVTVTLSAVDNAGGTGVKSTEYSLDNGGTWLPYTAPFTISTEGATTVQYRSTDNNNNIETAKSVTIKIDKTAPTIIGAATTDPNANGWYNTDVTVHFEATDATSGLDTVTEDTTLSTEAADQSVTGTATDVAGNSASFTVEGINIDKTAPTINGAPTTAANANGWYKTDVVIHFTAEDDGSGIESITPDVTLTDEGADQSVIGTVVDNAGNSSSFTVTGINIDKTAPIISGAATTAANANGWYKTDVTVHFEASDGLSGIDTVTPDTTLTDEGADQSVIGTATDLAGNSASFTVEGINIDKTAPTINGAATTAPNAAGWYKTDVTVHFTASDSLSGIDTLTPDTTLTGEGTGQSVTGTAVDKAGNWASATVDGINIDKTAPVITISTPATSYLLNATVPADWTATDALSGMKVATGTKACGELIDTATPGLKTFTVSTEDNAGNTASKTVTYSVLYAVSSNFFLPPINNDGTSVFKLGSTVPVKFQLRDANSAFVATAVAKIYVAKISNNVVGSEIEAVSTSNATTGNLFRYDLTANQYIFNLGTKGLSAGTWQIRVLLDDGTSKCVNISLK